MLIEPKIEELLKRADSRYTLVILSAKRARQINSYYSQLGENAKALSLALEEIALQKFEYDRPPEVEALVK